MTIKLALSALCLGLVLGLLGALAKTSPYKPLQWLGGTYSTIVRGIPELLWVLLIFGTVQLMRNLADLLGVESLELNALCRRHHCPRHLLRCLCHRGVSWRDSGHP